MRAREGEGQSSDGSKSRAIKMDSKGQRGSTIPQVMLTVLLSKREKLSEELRMIERQVSGPVVVADGMGGTAMCELVCVGHDNLISEIIRLEGDSATIQVNEETVGLMVNDQILKTRKRPLKTIAIRSDDVYIPRGVSVPALDKDALWEFEPKKLGITTEKERARAPVL